MRQEHFPERTFFRLLKEFCGNGARREGKMLLREGIRNTHFLFTNGFVSHLDGTHEYQMGFANNLRMFLDTFSKQCPEIPSSLAKQ
ncbi:hypothetical protein TNIN_498911 [Trichonephila inaurata madagascariensis]|uniref:Uncharacterized protein n=1 Tax=Trichonephila inaurata madagascariensis TaxID=2747483 RepID=A0A8X6WSU7_9ARAC|nr:hypothetical protein TNIN_498911 [Trichonephila inaurata madagascariensis]